MFVSLIIAVIFAIIIGSIGTLIANLVRKDDSIKEEYVDRLQAEQDAPASDAVTSKQL